MQTIKTTILVSFLALAGCAEKQSVPQPFTLPPGGYTAPLSPGDAAALNAPFTILMKVKSGISTEFNWRYEGTNQVGPWVFGRAAEYRFWNNVYPWTTQVRVKFSNREVVLVFNPTAQTIVIE